MKNTRKYIASLITIILTSVVLLFTQTTYLDAQCCRSGGHSGHGGGGSSHEHNKAKDDIKSELIREGEIDLKAIDVNEDGKVFQDQMHWNVISDSKGDCPICNMELKEVTLKMAKDNLIKNGFEVKQDI
ncbi:MAG: hypothetical protein M1419_00955 [Bacteroidetes bacterium]|nr:hypothetical protein [Bacteroidota bacterium]